MERAGPESELTLCVVAFFATLAALWFVFRIDENFWLRMIGFALASSAAAFGTGSEGHHRITMHPSNGEAQSWSTDLDVTIRAGYTHFVALWNPDQPQQGSHYAGEPTRVIVLPLVGIAAQGVSLAGTLVAGLTVTALNSLQHRTAHGEKTIARNAGADIESVPAGQATSLSPTPTAADVLPMAYRSNGKNGVTFEPVEADVGAAALGGLMQVHAAGDHPNTQSN